MIHSLAEYEARLRRFAHQVYRFFFFAERDHASVTVPSFGYSGERKTRIACSCRMEFGE